MATRVCAECAVPIRGGDGGLLVQGLPFCSDLCAEEYLEEARVGNTYDLISELEEAGW
jgi:endogenous inhibitor of DNA gyrase (YacG/DUF329 family)